MSSLEKQAALKFFQIFGGRPTPGNVLTANANGDPSFQAAAGGTDASLLSTGTLPDARLSSNVPLKDAANTFTRTQSIDVNENGDTRAVFVKVGTSQVGVRVKNTAGNSGGNAFELVDASDVELMSINRNGAVLGTSAYITSEVQVGNGQQLQLTPSAIIQPNSNEIKWSSTGTQFGTPDTGLARDAVNVLAITNGSTNGAAVRLRSMTAPAAATGGGHIYAKATGSGELYTLDGAGNETLISPHGIQQYLDAGGALLDKDVDPFPQISVERNVFIGKEVLTYRLKHDLQPDAPDWRIVRDLPPEEVQDWDDNQAAQARVHAERIIDAKVEVLNKATPEEQFTALDLKADEVHEAYASFDFQPKPSWMDRKEPETKQSFLARMWAKLGWK